MQGGKKKKKERKTKTNKKIEKRKKKKKEVGVAEEGSRGVRVLPSLLTRNVDHLETRHVPDTNAVTRTRPNRQLHIKQPPVS